MSENGPTSPDDPAWVDDIVRRALERADDPGPDAPSASASASTATPAARAAADSKHEVPGPTTATRAATPQPAAAPPPIATTPPTADETVTTEVSAEASAPPPASSMPRRARGADDPQLPHVPPTIRIAADEAGMPQHPSPTADAALPRQHAVAATAPQGATAAAYADTTSRRVADQPYPDAHDDVFDTAVGHNHGEPDADADADAMSGRMRGFLEWGAVVVGALAVALLIKTFLMQAYFIPSSSMENTLNIGDRVLVNKLSYQFGDIGRGDLVVFSRPPTQADGEDDLIKRVIALPGETVEISDGQVLITEVGSAEAKQLREPYLGEGVTTTGFVDTSGCVEATPTSCVIPDGHIFVLGDNRPGSKDGRFFGPIPEDLVVGRAFLRVWPLADISFL